MTYQPMVTLRCMPTLVDRPLDAREERAWRSFRQMERELAGRIRRQLTRDTGLSDADYEILRALADAPDSMLRARVLRYRLRWEKSRLSHQIGRMERRGLVAREDCDEDSRGSVIRLTGPGREAISAAHGEYAKAVRKSLIDRLNADQLDALTDISETVLASLAVED